MIQPTNSPFPWYSLPFHTLNILIYFLFYFLFIIREHTHATGRSALTKAKKGEMEERAREGKGKA